MAPIQSAWYTDSMSYNTTVAELNEDKRYGFAEPKTKLARTGSKFDSLVLSGPKYQPYY